MRSFSIALTSALFLSGCNIDAAPNEPTAASRNVIDVITRTPPPFRLDKQVTIDQPWAMAFMPDGRALITTRPGKLLLWPIGGEPIEIAGVAAVRHKEQGGLGDIKLSPDFARDRKIYFTYAEPVGALSRAALATAIVDVENPARPVLRDVTVIWRQSEAHEQPYHFSHRIAFSPNGAHLFLTSGERNEKAPAQDKQSNLGKVLRLKIDGSPAPFNPFSGQGGAADEIWSMGHRNLLGLAFADDGRLWEIEMGPSGGDELNLIHRGLNYGWPLVSQGDNYDGVSIPRHSMRPEFRQPQLYWNPSVNPSSLHIYHGRQFPNWRGKALVGALGGQAIMMIDLNGETATLLNRWPLDWRVRGFAESPDGTLWVIEDDPAGGIHRVAPKSAIRHAT